MSYVRALAPRSWPLSPQYTAAGKAYLIIYNHNPAQLRWIVSDTAPTDVLYDEAIPIEPGARETMTLATGEKLWVLKAGSSNSERFLIVIIDGESL